MRFRDIASSAIASFLFLCSATSAGAAAPSSAAPPAARVDLVLHFSLRDEAALEQLVSAQSDAGSPMYHHWLTVAQFRNAFGPTAATLRSAARALARHGFAVTHVDSQMIHFTGSAATVSRAFATSLRFARSAPGIARPIVSASTYRVPADIAATGATVIGLSEIAAPRPFSTTDTVHRDNRYGKTGPYWFDDLKEAYDYPSYEKADGSGMTIGVINFGDYQQSDVDAYFAHEKLDATGLAPEPATGHLYFGGASGTFGPNNSPSLEATLDMEQAAGSAPGATTINLDDAGYPYFYDSYSYIDDSDTIDIASISYGNCELQFSPAYSGGNPAGPEYLAGLHSLFLQGNSEGISFLAASGDNAARMCAPLAYYGAAAGTVYPSVAGVSDFVDDPNVTGVGGTNLSTAHYGGSTYSPYASESAYADLYTGPVDPGGTGNYLSPWYWGSSGGVSTVYAEPNFQRAYGLYFKGRAVPDVAMHMGGCPTGLPITCSSYDSADELYFEGALQNIWGTSASSPEFAGLLAVKASVTKQRYGNENYDLYLLARIQKSTGYDFFRQGIPGDNGVINVKSGQTGFNLITGLGSPYAYRFAAMPNTDLAGPPETAKNP